jgi:hypothetical protein
MIGRGTRRAARRARRGCRVWRTDAGRSPSTSSRPPSAGQRRARVPTATLNLAPALAVLDGLEEEAGCPSPTSFANAATGRLEVGQQLGPHRARRCARGRARGTRRGPGRIASSRHAVGTAHPARRSTLTRSAEEARARARCGTRPLPSWTTLNSSTSRRSRSTPRARTARRRSCRPCARPPGGCGSSRPSALVERHPQRLGVHPRHHQHVAVVDVLRDRRHEPVASYFTDASCSGVA